VATLLIVEDDTDIQDYYQILLAGLDLRTLRALTGREGLAFVDAGEPIDLILLDIVLPEMGGEDFFRALRTDRGLSIPVIVCSVDEKLVDPLRRIAPVQGMFLKGDPGSVLVGMISELARSRPFQRLPTRAEGVDEGFGVEVLQVLDSFADADQLDRDGIPRQAERTPPPRPIQLRQHQAHQADRLVERAAAEKAFWPVVASAPGVSWGRDERRGQRIFFISSIRLTLVCIRGSAAMTVS
jgi:CheY-like chemotaxis protein